MNVDVTVNGRPWTVGVEPAEREGTFTVTVGGKIRLIDASWIDAETLSLIDGHSAHEIRMHLRGDTGLVGVELGGRVYEAAVSDARLRTRSAGASGELREPIRVSGSPGAAKSSSVSHAIRAPMPGRVVRVLVGVGDRVAARQGVVVVEAMKMENELRTPSEGTVTQVSVAAGSTVDTGTVLLVIAH
jgi:biotin carboxyl carrier protein